MAMAPAVVVTPSTKLNLVNAQSWIQAAKGSAAGKAMTRLSASGSWPADPKEVYSYIGKTSSTRQFKDIKIFLGYNRKNPQLYAKPWRFEPLNVATAEDVIEAAAYAYRLLQTRPRGMFKNPTGRYEASHLLMGRNSEGVTQVLRNVPEAKRMDNLSQLWLTNTSEYASTVEANFFERHKNGGIYYFVAQKTAQAFPNLNITFTYMNIDRLGRGKGASLTGLPQVHKYMVPLIRIAQRGNFKARMSRPGRNIRRRASQARKKAKNK